MIQVRETLNLHADVGFKIVSCELEVGRKFDRWLDLTIMQLIFNPGEPPTDTSVEGSRDGTGKKREQKR